MTRAPAKSAPHAVAAHVWDTLRHVRHGFLARSEPTPLASIASRFLTHFTAALLLFVLALSALFSTSPDTALIRSVEASLTRLAGPDADVRIDDLGWALRGGRIGLRASGVRVALADRGTVDVADLQVGLGLPTDPRRWASPAEWRVSTVELEGVRLRRGGAGPMPNPLLIERELRMAAAKGHRRLRELGLERFSVRDISLVPQRDDAGRRERLKRRWFSLLSLDVRRTDEAYDLLADATLGMASVRLTGELPARGGATLFMPATALSKIWRSRSFGTEAPIAVTVVMPPDPSEPIWLEASLGEGSVELGKKRSLIDGGALIARIAENTATIDMINIAFGSNAVRGEGSAKLEGGNVRFALDIGEARLIPSDIRTAAVGPAASLTGRLEGTVRLAERVADLDRIEIAGQGGAVAGTGRIGLAGRSPAIALDLRSDAIEAATVLAAWPSWIGSGARDWLAQNLGSGLVRDARLRVDLAEGRLAVAPDPLLLKPEELILSATVEGGRVQTFGGLPALESASGTVAYVGRRLDVALSAGRMATPLGEAALAGSTLALPDTALAALPSLFEVALSGPASALAALADAEPFGAMERTGLAARELVGKAKGRVAGRVALRKPSEREWKVEMALDGVGSSEKIAGRSIDRLSGLLTVDPSVFSLEADGILDGIKARFALSEPLATPEPSQRRRRVTMALRAAELAVLAPGLETLLGGVTKVVADIEGKQVSLTADLREATLDLPWIGWRKASGVPGEATMRLRQEKGRVFIDDLRVNGRGFGVQGLAEADETGLRSARFERVRLSPDDDFSVEIARKAGRFHVGIRGARFDARSLLRKLDPRRTGSRGDDGGAKMELDARLGEMRGFGGRVMNDVRVALRSGVDGFETVSMRAAMPGGRRFVLDGTGGRTQSIFATTNDFGGALAFADLYSRMRGGVLTANATRRGSGSWKGFVDGSRMELIDEPKLKLLAGKAGRRSRALDARRVQFSRAFADFEFGDGRLAVSDGVVRGPEIGATFKGALLDGRGGISLTGTFLPAYGVNRVFGEVPVLGALLGNGRDKGLLGLTFRIAGTARQPTIEVNPLSLIAPGLFRRIFEYQP